MTLFDKTFNLKDIKYKALYVQRAKTSYSSPTSSISHRHVTYMNPTRMRSFAETWEVILYFYGGIHPSCIFFLLSYRPTDTSAQCTPSYKAARTVLKSGDKRKDRAELKGKRKVSPSSLSQMKEFRWGEDSESASLRGSEGELEAKQLNKAGYEAIQSRTVGQEQ